MRLADTGAGLNPQTFLLCFVYINVDVIIVRRLWRRKYIRNLYSQLLQFHDQQNTASYKRGKWQFYFSLLVMIVENVYLIGMSSIFVIIRRHLTSRIELIRKAVFIFSLTNTIMVPPTVEWQYTIQCVILRCSLAKLNENLKDIFEEAPIVEQQLIENRRRRTKLMRIVKAVNDEYGFELLILSNTLMLLSIYLCNDILLLVRVDSKESLWQSFSAHKLALNAIYLFALFVRLYWLCKESEKLAAEVRFQRTYT